jgi:hypothetical protein
MSLSLTFNNAYYDKKVKELNKIDNSMDDVNNMLYWDVDVNGTEVMVNIDIKNITANLFVGFTMEVGLLYPNNIFIKSNVKNMTSSIKRMTFLIEKVKPQKNIVFYIKMVHIRKFNIVLSGVYLNNTTMIETTQEIIDLRLAKPVYTRGIVCIKDASYMYREMSIIENKPNMFATVSFPSGYFGFVYENKRVAMSVWDAYMEDGTIIKNEVVEIGPDAIHSRFDHEGNGDNIALNYNIRVGHKYGFMVKNIISDKQCLISCYFIDLGPASTTSTNMKWLYLGTIKHHKLNDFRYNNTHSVLRGFYEHYSRTDGMLYRRSIMVGNTWGSIDGIEWVPSDVEEYEKVSKDIISNSRASILNERDGIMNVSVGGKINMDSAVLSLNRKAYRNIIKPPAHLDCFNKN